MKISRSSLTNFKISPNLILVCILSYLAISLLFDQYHKFLPYFSPFPYSNARTDLRSYYGLKENKAFVASVSLSSWAWSFGQPDRRDAERVALDICEKRGERCLLYALGNKIVWDDNLVRRTLNATVSSQELYGAVWRFYGETNPHGVTIIMPPGAPSIVSDYHSSRGIMGRLRAKFANRSSLHSAIDIIAPVGSPVLAAAAGQVLLSEVRYVGGLRIQIKHRAAEDQTVVITGYYHLNESFVEPGDTVVRGQPIGTVGVSGKGANARRPHLHFKTIRSNPHLNWYDGRGLVACFEATRTYTPAQTRLTYPVPCRPFYEGLQVAH